MATQKYRCKNFGNCDLADKRELISIVAGDEFDCPSGKANCKDTNLDPVKESGGGGPKKLILAALAGFVVVGALLFFLLPSDDAGTPSPVVPPDVTGGTAPPVSGGPPNTPPMTAPAPPVTNQCSLSPAKDADVARLLRYLKQGMNYASGRKFELALAEFAQALAIDRNFLALQQNIGAAHLGLGHYAEAEESFKAELKLIDCLTPMSETELAQYGYFFETGEQDAGRKQSAQAARLREQLPKARATAQYNLACSYSHQKKKDEGIAALRAAIAAGFDRRKDLDTDPDLAFLRSAPEFADVRKEMK